MNPTLGFTCTWIAIAIAIAIADEDGTSSSGQAVSAAAALLCVDYRDNNIQYNVGLLTYT